MKSISHFLHLLVILPCISSSNIWQACRNGDVKSVKRLQFENPTQDFLLQKNHKGDTPLHVACAFGKLDVIEALLSAKYIDYRKLLYSTNNEGLTPLLVLMDTRQFGLASILIKKDPSREHLTILGGGVDALLIAVRSGQSTLLQRLLNHLKPEDLFRQYSKQEFSILMAAATAPTGSRIAVKHLLEKDISNTLVLERSIDGKTALDLARESKSPAIKLLEREKNKRVKQQFTEEALDQVINTCRNGDVEAVKSFMRQKGAAAGQILCLRNEEGVTPMIEAVRSNQTDVVKVLLNVDGWHTEFCSGTWVNYRAQLMQSDKDGNHPLARALLRNADPEIALLFLDIDNSRKHLSVKNYRGRSPLMLAAENLHLEALRRIIKHLDAADLFEIDNIHESPLMLAAKNKDDNRNAVMAVEFLLAKDSTNLSVLMRNRQNQTALDLATKNGRIYGLLKRKHEDAKLIHDELMQACAAGNVESVKKFMIEAGTLTGSLLSIPAEDGDTPLIRAISNNQITVIGKLLNENNWHSFAIAGGEVDYKKQLRVRGSNGSPPLIWALESPKVAPSIASLLIRLDESMEHMLVKDSKGRNAAMVAASQGRVPQLREILSHLEQRSLFLQSKDEGKNVLMYALEEPENNSNSPKNAWATVDMLLNSSNLRLRHSRSSILGMSALEYAKQQPQTRQDVIDLLEGDRIEKFMSARTKLKVSKFLEERQKVKQSISDLGIIVEESKGLSCE